MASHNYVIKKWNAVTLLTQKAIKHVGRMEIKLYGHKSPQRSCIYCGDATEDLTSAVMLSCPSELLQPPEATCAEGAMYSP